MNGGWKRRKIGDGVSGRGGGGRLVQGRGGDRV